MKRQKWIWTSVAVMGTLVAGVILVRSVARADTPASINIVLPDTVSVTLNQHKIIFVGRSGGLTNVACQQGDFPSQSAVVVDPGGGVPSQLTSTVPLHDHEIQNGTRYLIVGNLSSCGAGFTRYNANLD